MLRSALIFACIYITRKTCRLVCIQLSLKLLADVFCVEGFLVSGSCWFLRNFLFLFYDLGNCNLRSYVMENKFVLLLVMSCCYLLSSEECLYIIGRAKRGEIGVFDAG